MYQTPYGNYNNYRRFQPPTNQQTFLNRSSTRNHDKRCITCGAPVSCTQIFYCPDCCYCHVCKKTQEGNYPPIPIQTRNAPTPLPIEIIDEKHEEDLDMALQLAENSTKKLGQEIKKLKRSNACVGKQLTDQIPKKKVKLEDFYDFAVQMQPDEIPAKAHSKTCPIGCYCPKGIKHRNKPELDYALSHVRTSFPDRCLCYICKSLLELLHQKEISITSFPKV